MKKRNLLVATVMAGLISGMSVARADEHEAAAGGEAKTAEAGKMETKKNKKKKKAKGGMMGEKSGCKGKDGCKGKGGCEGKEKEGCDGKNGCNAKEGSEEHK